MSETLSFLEEYFSAWNNLQPSEAKMKPFVSDRCENRFGLSGPGGMAESIGERHEVFDDYFIEFELIAPSQKNQLDVSLYVTCTFNPSNEVANLPKEYIGKKIEFYSQVNYDLDEDGLIIGGRSNMRHKILESLVIAVYGKLLEDKFQELDKATENLF
ncbi:MAG: hypothetical protein ABFQ62_00855 [Patescibacteria group bacterium]